MQSTSSVFLEPLIPRVHQLCQSRQIHVSLQSFPRFFLNKELGEDFQVDKLGTSVLSWEFSDGIFRLSPAIQHGWQDWKKHLTDVRFLLSYIHVYPMFAYRAPGIYIIYIYVNHRFNVPEYKETIHAYAYTMYVCYFTVRICISHLMIFYIQ